ncbi:MAG TPA: tetratricopeptide repeat protein [Anaeromyxobacter sp.]|nr:tetratricopeptide repeat protein [Anaeromyxobacter sp.]
MPEKTRRLGLPLLALAALVAAGAAALALGPRLRRSPPPAPPSALSEHVASWRAAGLVPHDSGPAAAEARRAEGRAALASDDPARIAAAVAAFRAALAAQSSRLDALAGFAIAVSERVADDPDSDADDVRVAHELLAEARAHAPEPPELVAAYARLLLAVPSASNDAEALAAARRAHDAAPRDPDAALALGLALARREPAAGAALLEDAAAAAPEDRRLLSAAARARWAAGDAPRALALASHRLALDPGHPGALALRAEIELAAGRFDDARATRARWGAADPGSALPPLLLARLAHQVDRDVSTARALLDAALARARGDFTAARVLAERAALERGAGDRAAAARAVAEALRRVPASAPARFQEALLAFDSSDVRALRRAEGVLDGRAGPAASALLTARVAELGGTLDEAVEAYARAAAAAPRDPAALLAVAGALARLGASGPALDVARGALRRDLLESRLPRPPSELWEGRAPVAEAARRLEAIGRYEPGAAATALAAAAACEVVLGRTVAAARLAREAAVAAPQAATPLALLAQIELDRGRPAAAAPLARAAVEAGTAPLTLAVLGRALEALGREAESERVHRAALSMAPDLATSRLALARLLARRGDVAGARTLLAGILADDPGIAPARGALLALEGGAEAPAAQASATPP